MALRALFSVTRVRCDIVQRAGRCHGCLSSSLQSTSIRLILGNPLLDFLCARLTPAKRATIMLSYAAQIAWEFAQRTTMTLPSLDKKVGPTRPLGMLFFLLLYFSPTGIHALVRKAPSNDEGIVCVAPTIEDALVR